MKNSIISCSLIWTSEINRRLARMRGNGGFTETDVGTLLSRLREQDRRNQRNLDELRQQLHDVTGVKPLSPRNTLAAEIRFVT